MCHNGCRYQSGPEGDCGLSSRDLMEGKKEGMLCLEQPEDTTMDEKLLPCPFLSDCGIEMAKWKRAIIDSCPNRRAPDPLAERLVEALRLIVRGIDCPEGIQERPDFYKGQEWASGVARAALAAWEGRKS